MSAVVAVAVRLLAIVGKELTETIRRPGAILSLVVGPFLILALFGAGYDGVKRPLETIVVVPPSSGLPTDAASYQALAGGGLEIVAVTADRAAAEGQLATGAADVVVVAPGDAAARFRAGETSIIDVVIDVVDPIQANYAGFLAAGLSSAVNRAIIERAVTEGQAYAIDAGLEPVDPIPPAVVAAPTEAQVRNAAPTAPTVIGFFGPAVLALVIQHVAISLVALSLVRERTSGIFELFRVAPVSAAEVLGGKLVAFGLLGAGIAAITTTLLVVGFGIPMLADPAAVAGVMGLLLLAALGVGMLIAVIADTERQAVQLSLLVLLASVFFSGLVLSIEEFAEPVRALAYLLPVTHGIRLLQDLFLRGSTTVAWEAAALGAIAATTLVAAWLLLRRAMQRA